MFWVCHDVLGVSRCSGYVTMFWVFHDVLGVSRCSGCVTMFWVCHDVPGVSRCSGCVTICWVYHDVLDCRSSGSGFKSCAAQVWISLKFRLLNAVVCKVSINEVLSVGTSDRTYLRLVALCTLSFDRCFKRNKTSCTWNLLHIIQRQGPLGIEDKFDKEKLQHNNIKV
jgi:hypothetical protein